MVSCLKTDDWHVALLVCSWTHWLYMQSLYMCWMALLRQLVLMSLQLAILCTVVLLHSLLQEDTKCDEHYWHMHVGTTAAWFTGGTCMYSCMDGPSQLSTTPYKSVSHEAGLLAPCTANCCEATEARWMGRQITSWLLAMANQASSGPGGTTRAGGRRESAVRLAARSTEPRSGVYTPSSAPVVPSATARPSSNAQNRLTAETFE